MWAQDAAGQETMPGAMEREPMQTGEYAPSWESLSKYECPEWFRDAKFGIWAHWGPQCEPESGDWYARNMYYPGEWQYNVHLQKYGNPKDFGFKDVIHIWEAEEWEPDSLVRFYKSVGARYFMALANHHDNLDLWDSRYQPWNSVNMGPKRNIVGEWAEACKKYDLPLGLSIHASHTWTWMEGSQDFDGKLTKEDGVGQWWEGYDPQEFYEQRHERSAGSESVRGLDTQWDWGNGASLPDERYKTKFYNRTLDVINRYDPDVVYFDDFTLPFYPISDEGLDIVAHMYNKSLKDNDGEMRAVVTGKKLTVDQKEAIVWDVERGIPDRPQEKYWQTCTCLGQWHYDRGVYDRNEYKSAPTVIKMLVDIVSKNGNLLLSVPLRGSGAIDEKELAILNGIKAWMDINGESIYGTRPWGTFGEGPTAEASNPINNQGFNEGTNYTSEDIRYVQKDGVVYATALGWPTDGVMELERLSAASPYCTGKVASVELLGYGPLEFSCDETALTVALPEEKPNEIAPVLKVAFTEAVTYEDFQILLEQADMKLEEARMHVGHGSGFYQSDYVERLSDACGNAREIGPETDGEALSLAYLTLQQAYSALSLEALMKGGMVEDEELAQNVTIRYLEEARHFSRTDEPGEGTTRFGLLAEPWVVTPNIINKDNNTHGGFDSYIWEGNYSGRAIGVQKWEKSEAAIENGMIYQTTTLPAGDYSLRLNVHEQNKFSEGEACLAVVEGADFFESENAEGRVLASFDMSGTSSGATVETCRFSLDKETTVSLGWHVNLPADAVEKSMRISAIYLLADGTDVSERYLKNYENIQRKDKSYERFGVSAHWETRNYYIPQSNGDGIKRGIDYYNGYNALMLGIWDDAEGATGDLSNVALYRRVKLPAGTYFFGAAYENVYEVEAGYIFVSAELCSTDELKTHSIAYSSMDEAAKDGSWYGLKFTLPEDSTIYLGWMADFTQGGSQQEFRMEEVVLLRYLDEEAQWVDSLALTTNEDGWLYMPAASWAKVVDGNLAEQFGQAPYVALSNISKVQLGQVDLTGVERMKFVMGCDHANEQPKCRIVVDNEDEPWGSVSVPYAPSLYSPGEVEIELEPKEGVHTVWLEMSGDAKLFSVEFLKDGASQIGEIAPGNDAGTFDVECVGGMLKIPNLENDRVRIYGADGRIFLVKERFTGDLMFRLPVKGLYIVKVGDQTRKVAYH